MISKAINKIIEHQAKVRPNEICILGVDRSPITYSLLYSQVKKTMNYLSKLGIGRNERVAIVLPNGPEMATAFLSIASGATAAPLNPNYREAEYEFFLSDLNARALITIADLNPAAVGIAKKLGIPVVELSPSQRYAGSFDLIGEEGISARESGFAHTDDIALVLHTSGTTSRPKIVPLTHKNLTTSANNIRTSLELTSNDRCLNTMPLFHIHGLMAATLATVTEGASLVCTPGFFAPQFFSWVNEFSPTWYTAVPTMHQAILERVPKNLNIIQHNQFRFIRSSSAALPPELMSDLEKWFNCPIIEAYGMTEASHQMASNPLPPLQRKLGSVGQAAGPEVAIMEESGNKILEMNSIGEVVIRGGNVTNGYENNPEANATAFTEGWFRTGDQGYLDTDDYLFLTGRLKEIINRGGEKISPREIDEILLSHTGVKQALSFAFPDDRLGEDIAAAVILSDTGTTEDELRNYASNHLAHFKVPKQIIILDKIPKGPTGKLQRIGLAEKLGVKGQAPKETPNVFEAPTTPTEKALAELWCEILDVDELSINQRFLDLGGDSILAGRLINRIQHWFDVDIPFIVFFDASTIKELAIIAEKLLLDKIDNENL